MTICALRNTILYSRRCTRILISQRRTLSRTSGGVSYHDAVDLSYTSIVPEDGNATVKPLVILHGLFGSKRNWGSLCKAFHRDMPHRPIYALDLRNHGASPHATPMNYESMASDVHKFIEEKGLKEVSLMGHSMGGKVAMAYALSLKNWDVSPEIISQLIIVDIAPSIGSLSPEFIRYIHEMQKIESLPSGVIKTRTDADHRLKTFEPDMSVRQFLLTNLQLPSHSRAAPHDGAQDKAKFIVPLDILSNSIPSLGSFPYQYNAEDNSVPVTWEGPTLVTKGTKSAYINHKNTPALRAFFPNMHLEELDTRHWVHAEKPHEFRQLVVDFLNDG